MMNLDLASADIGGAACATLMEEAEDETDDDRGVASNPLTPAEAAEGHWVPSGDDLKLLYET